MLVEVLESTDNGMILECTSACLTACAIRELGPLLNIRLYSVNVKI